MDRDRGKAARDFWTEEKVRDKIFFSGSEAIALWLFMSWAIKQQERVLYMFYHTTIERERNPVGRTAMCLIDHAYNLRKSFCHQIQKL